MIKGILIVVLSILTLITLPFFFVQLLMISWSSIHSFVSIFAFAAIVLFYGYVWSMALSRCMRNRWLTKKKQLCIAGPLIVCLLVTYGTLGYERWNSRYAVMSAEVDLQEYQPFMGKKLAKLSEESSYHMKKNLLTLDGATALYPIYASYVQAVYPKDDYDPYLSELVRCSKTTEAYERLLRKESDLIFVAAPSQKQLEKVKAAGEELVMTPIGKEAFVFFVNAENPVTELSSKQIKDIYSGDITNWKQVGGKDSTIRAFQRPEGSGSQSAFLRFMGNHPVAEAMTKDVPSGMGDILNVVSEYENRENAIGYSFRFYTQVMNQHKDIRLLKVDGITPDEEHIRNDSYPITSPFYAIHLKSNQNENLKPFLSWIIGKQGQELIEKTGYVALR